MFWWLLACPHREPDPSARVVQLLAASDQAWGNRGGVGYDGASQPLLAAYALAPDLPGVQWRVARWRLAEGLADDDPVAARQSFAEARATAVRCLEGNPSFVARRAQEGWAAALGSIGPDRQPCAAWAALAWARWLERYGASAASLDLPTVDALIERAATARDPDVREIGAWADGIVSAIRPDWDHRDPQRAARQLRATVEADPASVVRWVDLYELVVEPAGDEADRDAMRDRILALPVTNPEDACARRSIANPS